MHLFDKEIKNYPLGLIDVFLFVLLLENVRRQKKAKSVILVIFAEGSFSDRKQIQRAFPCSCHERSRMRSRKLFNDI